MTTKTNDSPPGLRRLLIALTIMSFLCVGSCRSQTVASLSSYATLQTVDGIYDDENVQHRLQALLGKDYQPFVSNFDVWGEPRKLPDAGLMVEGWLRDLYLYEASAFAIFPDGRIYASRADVADKSGGTEGTIRYYSNDPAYRTIIYPALAQWSVRFHGATTLTPDLTGIPQLQKRRHDSHP